MDTCNICNNDFKESTDSIVYCEFKEGFVHLGCCIDACSQNKMPCTHALAFYDKVS